jgi:hypothetical protein
MNGGAVHKRTAKAKMVQVVSSCPNSNGTSVVREIAKLFLLRNDRPSYSDYEASLPDVLKLTRPASKNWSGAVRRGDLVAGQKQGVWIVAVAVIEMVGEISVRFDR